MKILVIDVGGTHVKLMVTGCKTRLQFDSGLTLTPKKMVATIKAMTREAGWKYDVIGMGYPGPVVHGHPMVEPHNLGKGWVGFDFGRAFGKPVKIINDAAMQALGSYEGKRMLFLGLGTGLGSALIVDGVVEPLELAHLPFKKGRTYEDYVGMRGLERLGKKKWRKAVAEVVKLLKAATQADYVVLGGGNSRLIKKFRRARTWATITTPFAAVSGCGPSRSTHRNTRRSINRPIYGGAMSANDRVAFGAPGIEPRWTSSAKEGFGTSYHTSCRMWFTLSHGIVNEIYYPSVDQPNTRDFQYLITDGETFCHEEKSDLVHELEYPIKGCLFYKLTNSEPKGRYKLVKQILTDPHRSVLLVHTKLEILDDKLKDKLRLYALLAPHIERSGAGNTGRCEDISGSKLLHARRNGFHLVMGCTTHFSRMSVGYAGASDGWQDLRNYKMDWEFTLAEDGNVALTGEIDPRRGTEFTVAIAMGQSFQSAAAKLLQSLAYPFDKHREGYERQWKRAFSDAAHEYPKDTGDGGGMVRLSRCVLLSHEDKVFEGALVASMSIPWGETKGDYDLGGYHLVWTRDLVQSATALLATGQGNTPLRAMIWLAVIQRADGSFPQNSWINGRMYWAGLQLDEIAAPILLAWRLRREGVTLGQCNPSGMIRKAAAFLLLEGPVTGQDRWEENAGYSPSTLAGIIAGLVCAADFEEEQADKDFILAYADWMEEHVEEWTVTTRGDLVPGKPRHYIRINPADPIAPDPDADPNTTMIQVANGGGLHHARNLVGGDFLHLVRYGIKAHDDPIILSSVEVIDRVLKRELPQGPCWRRYNHDGYGQYPDGSAFDGGGEGRSWPILTGERGHYELAAGRDPLSYIKAMEAFGNEGGMISEQLWDAEDLPNGRMKKGAPTGAAMPLCWSHAEYISLVRSRHDGVCFDRVEPAYQRYIAKPVKSGHEMWTLRHQIRRMPRKKTLRVIVGNEAMIVWTMDNWATSSRTETICNGALNVWYADFATEKLPAGAAVEFTFFWKKAQQWEGRNYSVKIK